MLREKCRAGDMWTKNEGDKGVSNVNILGRKVLRAKGKTNGKA